MFLLSLGVDLLVQADVVGALVGAGGGKAPQGLPILKIQGQVDGCGLPRKVEHADSLVTDQIPRGGVAHVAVGDEPGVFSDICHFVDSFLFR